MGAGKGGGACRAGGTACHLPLGTQCHLPLDAHNDSINSRGLQPPAAPSYSCSCSSYSYSCSSSCCIRTQIIKLSSAWQLRLRLRQSAGQIGSRSRQWQLTVIDTGQQEIRHTSGREEQEEKLPVSMQVRLWLRLWSLSLGRFVQLPWPGMAGIYQEKQKHKQEEKEEEE